MVPAFAFTLTEWQHHALDITTRIVAAAAVLHTLLPPWDWEPEFVTVGLSDFPHLQNAFRKSLHNRYYKLLIYTVGYVAVHGRSTLWRSISVGKQKENAVHEYQTKNDSEVPSAT